MLIERVMQHQVNYCSATIMAKTNYLSVMIQISDVCQDQHIELDF